MSAALLAPLFLDLRPCVAGQEVDSALPGKWHLIKFNGRAAPESVMVDFYRDGRVVVTQGGAEVTGTYLTARRKSRKRITLKLNVEDSESDRMKAEIITGGYTFVRGRLVLETLDRPTPSFLFTISGRVRMEFERLPSSHRTCVLQGREGAK
jgi:hypothetical protein